MNRFTGTATPLTAQGIEACAARLSVHPAEIWTVLRVETRGCGYFADRRPVILFERHVFSRKTGHRFDAQAPDISNPHAGGYGGGVKEYERLARALALDEQAAMESASWGLGQVMGFNATDLGYASVEQFVSRMMASEDEQLAALAAFIQKNGLAEPLRHHDWAAFARGYNGPGYEKNQYDKKLAEAYQHLTSRSLPDLSVREGQLLLTYLGFDPGSVDGASGPHTLAALHKFQSQNSLPTTPGFDAATLEALRQRHQALPVATPAVTGVPAPQPVAVPAPQPAPEVRPVAAPLATLPASAPATPSALMPAPSAPLMAVPEPSAVPVMEASPLPAQLAEQLGHRLSQSLNKDVQEELARLLALRPRVAQELGPTAVQTVDMGLTALLVEQPNLAFVRGIRRRVTSALADQLYPLRPLPILRSSSPSMQVVLGLGLMLLTAHGLSAFFHMVLTSEQTLLFGLPLRTMLLVGLCGAIGSSVSMLTRLGDFEKQRGVSRTSMLMLGFFKPVVGMYCALFCFALMKSGLLPLQAKSPDSELYLYMAVCFLAGFSERFAQDVFARAEQALSSAHVAQPSPTAPPPTVPR
jgi:hypothetical protein